MSPDDRFAPRLDGVLVLCEKRKVGDMDLYVEKSTGRIIQACYRARWWQLIDWPMVTLGVLIGAATGLVILVLTRGLW